MINILEEKYKGEKSIVLESGRIRAEFISQGARMVSFVDKKTRREILLQSNNKEFIKRKFDSIYPECDPAGFDDMFPTILECYCEEFPWEGIKIADHGEVWSLDWSIKVQGNSVIMSVHGVRFPYILQKRVYFKDDETLRFDYLVQNMSHFDISFLWTAHPMMQVDEGTRIVMPPECKTGYTVCCSCGRLGEYGHVFDIEETLKAERNGNVSVSIRGREKNDCEKYYIRERLSNGFCRMEFPKDGSSLEFRFPVETVPYLAVLISEGYEGNPNWAIIEPATAPYDRVDFAKAYGSASKLKADSSYEWYLEMTLGG